MVWADRPGSAGVRIGAAALRRACRNAETFGAYYMPCGEDTTFAGEVTPLNMLRKVFSYYLGADLPSMPDSSYFSVTKRPFDFVRFVPRPDGSLSGPLPIQ